MTGLGGGLSPAMKLLRKGFEEDKVSPCLWDPSFRDCPSQLNLLLKGVRSLEKLCPPIHQMWNPGVTFVPSSLVALCRDVPVLGLPSSPPLHPASSDATTSTLIPLLTICPLLPIVFQQDATFNPWSILMLPTVSSRGIHSNSLQPRAPRIWWYLLDHPRSWGMCRVG